MLGNCAEYQVLVDFIALRNVLQIFDCECGALHVGNCTDDIFSLVIATQHVAWMKAGLNVADNRVLLELVDGVFEVWAMFLQNIGTEGMVSLNLNFVSFWTDEVCQTVTHIAGAGFSKS